MSSHPNPDKLSVQWQKSLTSPNAKLRACFDKDSDIPLYGIWKSDIESEHFKALIDSENEHEEYSTENVHSTHVEHGNNLEPSKKDESAQDFLKEEDNDEDLVTLTDNIKNNDVTGGDGIDQPEPTRQRSRTRRLPKLFNLGPDPGRK
eukprot:5669568-Ditylum_brightwellii.AAC.1